MAKTRPAGSDDQHTVQRALLLGFGGTDKFLQCRDRAGHDWKISAKRASAEDHFYTFDDQDGTRQLAVDHGMRDRVERTFPELRDAVQKGSLTARQRRDFDLYVALSMMRTTGFRDLLRQAEAFAEPYMVRQETARFYEKDLSAMRWNDRASFDQAAQALFRARKRDPRDSRIQDLRTFVDQSDIAYKKLQNLRWCHYALEAPALITSDAGVGVVRPHPDDNGLLPRRAIVVLPLAPNSLAIAATKDQHRSLDGPMELAAMSNQAMSDGAHRQTYRHPEMPWPKDVSLSSSGPQLKFNIATSGSKRAMTQDATADLQNHYARSMHPFLRGLMDQLMDSLPIEP